MMNRLRHMTEWYVSIAVSVVFAVCAVTYFKAIDGLIKPAGIVEAIKFLVSSPKEYVLCLLCGSVAKISFTILAIIAIISLVNLVLMFKYIDGEYENIEIKDIIRYIVNCILAIVVGIIQTKIISNFWILIITLIIICLSLIHI